MKLGDSKKQPVVLIALVLVLVVPFPSTALALNSEVNRETLRGLKGVKVLIEELSSDIEKAGLARNQIQEIAETKLRKAGIRVLTQEECYKTPGEPYLYININLNPGKAGEEKYAYSIDIGVIQNVALERDPKQKTYAVTWSTGGVGSIGREFLSRLQESVEDLVSIFIGAFLSVNQETSSKTK